MRAKYPDVDAFVERDGVKLHYEVYNPEGEPTVFLMPTWSIVHSRMWKAQIPYLARHYRVLTFDGRGNGLSDRPERAEAYAEEEYVRDAVAVMEAAGIKRAVVVGFSRGCGWTIMLGARYPERVSGIVFIGPAVNLGSGRPSHSERISFTQRLERYEGWAKRNMHYWRQDYRDWIEFFMGNMCSEPHSTKQTEDTVSWGLDTDAETLINTARAPRFSQHELLEAARSLRCPVLVLHGQDDRISPRERGDRLAEETGGVLVRLDGSGHAPQTRDPVKVNLLIKEFIDSLSPQSAKTATWVRGRGRPKRALYICSPIGLGHAHRDLSVAQELRKLHPDLEIEWLAQDPVTRVLEVNQERIHPASKLMASEVKHIDSQAGEHDLHVFQTWREMDEILVANFMLTHGVLRQGNFDLVIGDEAWELDYFLHENPELKNTAYAWFTDFVGWIPMPDGGDRERTLTADYNAEMIEQIARYPRVRDRAIFVGSPEDIVPAAFGDGLPLIRDWTTQHYSFSGYITGFDPADFADREAIRAELGYREAEQVCIVAVGGSGVGAPLLRRIIEAYPEAKRRLPALRMIVVAGPRIDPESLPRHKGVEARAYVPQLYKHLAACDLAVVQGGLTTTMELVANRCPFLYFPLRHHFEQNFHVRHRLDRYGAGCCMDYATATPEVIAEAMAQELSKPVEYRPVERGGAARAAAMIADLL